ncbi:acetyl/propionyl/methylcrotonyl-CoA carboxylase subunit alpha [Rhodococcus pyridinivorans]|uniref:acetyl/propionyl/methylcrotonyl-CoA carboxylase subunit alpha n=1 Tax=Rhodococcus pyridinivorans TaxID=103816 RepID=UPI002078C2BD|nr:biotin carboxylase N-terminal domain-containing protein [Rhodococcus pyridinivorans]USI92441.1 acetyl/propionyl-CoA carboxylase subunit alpha [Rhodococcus pyridinivorans]
MTESTITTVLVANRGEIARRVFASCRRAGLGGIAVFSDADANSPHVGDADAAVRLAGVTPSETYLDGKKIVAAALATGADAVHPGYGFLSENARFAREVLEAGLIWIGPCPESIERMGSKVEAKKIMADTGVPVLAELDPADITDADLPVLVKASAGGGGRGMRVVRTLADLPGQLDAARREAASAFGDPTVFCERYLENGRHIEVQILADRHGTVWAVGERECSIQRRHQKVIEEAPSPLVDAIEGMRPRLFDAARRAAQAIGYEGAGTVEFLADRSGRFHFLEMNTRLQVEHPVTECTTGLDLVDLQFRIADGDLLDPEPPPVHGHSVEARLYAEDPARDWQPQSGTVHRFALPQEAREFDVLRHTGVRVDSGVLAGSEVGVHYDAMLAKIISYAPTRDRAVRLLASTLTRTEIHGIVTNRDLLVAVLKHPAFRAGETDTAFFDTHGLTELSAPLASAHAEAVSAIAAALAESATNRTAATVNAGLPSGWRNLPSQPQATRFTGVHNDHVVRYRVTRDGVHVDGRDDLGVVGFAPDRVVLDVDGVRRHFVVARYGDAVHVDSSLGPVRLTAVPRFVDPTARIAAGSLLAPMPGSVIRLGAAVGDVVEAGRPLVWLEAMKMKHTVTAPTAGTLTTLAVEVGDQVAVGTVLAVVTPHDVSAPVESPDSEGGHHIEELS